MPQRRRMYYDEKVLALHTESQAEISSDEEVIVPKRKKQKLQKHTKEEPLLVAICTPLMARVHQGIPQAGEMMFVDSTASIDRYNLSMFLLSTSHVGVVFLLELFLFR